MPCARNSWRPTRNVLSGCSGPATKQLPTGLSRRRQTRSCANSSAAIRRTLTDIRAVLPYLLAGRSTRACSQTAHPVRRDLGDRGRTGGDLRDPRPEVDDRGSEPPEGANLIQHEIVRRPGFDVPLAKLVSREVPEVAGDYGPGASLNRCCENVTVTGVRQLQALDQRLAAGDEAVPHGAISVK